MKKGMNIISSGDAIIINNAATSTPQNVSNPTDKYRTNGNNANVKRMIIGNTVNIEIMRQIYALLKHYHNVGNASQ